MERVRIMKYVRVNYRGARSLREYGYQTDLDVEVGDTVVVPIGSHEKHAIIVSIEDEVPDLGFEIKKVIRVGE